MGTPCAIRLARNPSPGGELAEEMRGRLPFHSRIGGKDQLPHSPFVENGFEVANTELLRTDSIERRQVPHQHEIPASVTTRLLDSNHIGWRFDDTQTAKSPDADAKQVEHSGSSVSIRQRPRPNDRLQRNIQRTCERTRTRPAFPEGGGTPCAEPSWANTRQGTECVYELSQMRRMLHVTSEKVISIPAAVACLR